MIRYALKCSAGHGFEAWFRDSAAYNEQAGSGAIRCPECGTPDVGKAPMAPRISKRSESNSSAPAPAATEGPATQMSVAGGMREALQQMRRLVESNADYVGPRFAEEARKIHQGEAEERNIYGESTDDEAETLRDEGIPFVRIPWPKDDA